MTGQEIRDTIRQMTTDWNAATPAQQDRAVARAAGLAAAAAGSPEATL